MIFNKTVEYALSTVIFLSGYPKFKPISQKEISGLLDIPYHYLAKIVKQLTEAGITNSKTGPGGGVFLIKQPEEVVLSEILEIFVGKDYFDGCILGRKACDESPCALHNDWSPVHELLKNIFNNHNIHDWSKKN